MKLLMKAAAATGLLVGGCAIQPVGTFTAFDADRTSIEQTALIRPATKEEKQEDKANLLVRLFVNPSGQGSIVRLLAVSRPDAEQLIALDKYESVRVPAGEYLVRAQCILPAFRIFFDVPMVVVGGGVYLLECTGNTANAARIHYRLTSSAQKPASQVIGAHH